METLVNFISQPWLGSFLGIIGLGATVFFYLRSRKIRRLAYQYHRVSLLGADNSAFPEEIEIRFAGARVDRVTAETIILWNGGNTTIEGREIVESDPLRIQVNEGQILRANVLKATREVNALRLIPRNEQSNTVDVYFDYLDPGDGAAFEVLHSGGRSDLRICGTIRGIPSGVINDGPAPFSMDYSLKQVALPFGSVRNFLLVSLILGLIMVAYGLLLPYLLTWFPVHAPQPEPPAKSACVYIGMGALIVVMALWVIWMRRRRYPPSLIRANVSG